MKNMTKARVFALIICIVTPILIGFISAMLTMKDMRIFSAMDKPYFCPPGIVFSIVWTILYILMGIASYFVLMTNAPTGLKMLAFTLYAIQLIMNFFWSLIFFQAKAYLLAFVWLAILFILVVLCMITFFRVKTLSGVLFIPYVAWLILAGYMNMAAYLSPMPR